MIVGWVLWMVGHWYNLTGTFAPAAFTNFLILGGFGLGLYISVIRKVFPTLIYHLNETWKCYSTLLYSIAPDFFTAILSYILLPVISTCPRKEVEETSYWYCMNLGIICLGTICMIPGIGIIFTQNEHLKHYETKLLQMIPDQVYIPWKHRILNAILPLIQLYIVSYPRATLSQTDMILVLSTFNWGLIVGKVFSFLLFPLMIKYVNRQDLDVQDRVLRKLYILANAGLDLGLVITAACWFAIPIGDLDAYYAYIFFAGLVYGMAFMIHLPHLLNHLETTRSSIFTFAMQLIFVWIRRGLGTVWMGVTIPFFVIAFLLDISEFIPKRRK